MSHLVRLYIGGHGCLCKIVWFYVKHWPSYSTLLPTRLIFVHFCTLFRCILQPAETASEVTPGTFVRLIVRDRRVKFRYPGLNYCRGIPPTFSEIRYLPTGSSLWRHIRCLRGDGRCEGSFEILWFSVKPFSRYTTDSLFDGRTNERRTATPVITINSVLCVRAWMCALKFDTLMHADYDVKKASLLDMSPH